MNIKIEKKEIFVRALVESESHKGAHYIVQHDRESRITNGLSG